MTVFHHGPTALRVLEGVFPYHSWQSDTPDNLAQHGATHVEKFMCTLQTLDMQGFLVELLHAPQTHFTR